MRRRLIFAILVMGFSGIVVQILLLREFLVVFSGNELAIGIILANWLILEAFGSLYVGKRVEHIKERIEAFVGLQLFFSLCLPLAVYSTRILKDFIGVIPGEGLGLIPILYSSFLIFAPLSIAHGALFTFCCKLYSLHFVSEGKAIGKVYVHETLGTIFGAFAFTYLFVPYLHSIQIALGVALLNSLLCLLLLGSSLRKSLAGRALAGGSAVFLVLCAYLIIGPKADEIHHLSISQQWRGQEVVHYQNSIYGNITVTQRDEQYSFFSGGIPIITTPVPDITFVEEFVHLPLLFHPEPKKVLVIGGGVGGVIHELLKHPIERVDYTELDPLILKVVQEFPTPLTEAELADPRVNIEYLDGRFFIKKTPHKYDLVLVGISNPSTLQINRLFSKEFFSLVKERLEKGGILVMVLAGSLTYLSEELGDLNACILNTLKGVYPYVRVIPGDFNLFLASISSEVSLINHTLLSQRLNERELEVSLLTPSHIKYKLDSRRVDWFFTSLKGATEKINQDFSPLGMFYSLAYWNSLFSPRMKWLFRWFEQVNLRLLIIPLSIFTLIFLIIYFKGRTIFTKLSIPFAIMASGFAGMIFDLALIYTFQALYGYVFHQIGLLVAAFMVGIAVGSLAMTSLLKRVKRDFASFIGLELAMILFSGALPAIFLLFSPYLDRPAVFSLFRVIFLVLSFFSGLLIGTQFPLANKIYLKRSPDLSGTAGLLYGADLAGGWIGGLLGGVVLLPVLGLVQTCIAVVLLKMTSLLILLVSALLNKELG
ncbi:spermine synthase [candidate division KSB1 bacterium]|nr:spermine synthase [candidate division KSB1 bacterium]